MNPSPVKQVRRTVRTRDALRHMAVRYGVNAPSKIAAAVEKRQRRAERNKRIAAELGAALYAPPV